MSSRCRERVAPIRQYVRMEPLAVGSHPRAVTLQRLSAVAMVIVALGACSSTTTQSGRSPELSGTWAVPKAEGPSPNWDSPLPNALSYRGDLALPVAVRKSLSFPITVPAFGLAPQLIRVTNPASATGAGRSIAFLYDFSGRDGFGRDGRLVVYESVPRSTEADLLAMPKNPPGPPEDFTVVDLGSSRALFVHHGGVGRVEWISSGVDFDITGPAAPSDSVLRLGRTLAAQA